MINKNIYTTHFRFLFFIGMYVLIFQTACKRDIDSFDGPSLIDRFGEFVNNDSLSVNRTEVDFSAGETVIFTAEFNKNVEWQIIITGTESGAVKRITGFDRFINDENATWTGGTTDLPFFKNEVCTVELRVPEEVDFLQTAEVQITGTKIYPGNVFADFEAVPGSNIEVGNFEFEFTNQIGRQNTLPAAQGDYYYFLEGTDNVVPNFFVGLINIKSSITGQTYAPLPTTVPNQLYFNCFLYHDGSPNGIAVIQFAFDSNNSGAFEDGQDQTFQLEGDFPLNWTGWRHIHHPMSALGMTQEQLQKIVSIRVLLMSDLNNQPSPPQPVRFGIDYLTFTQGGRLEL
jgi:hypothetical protein